LTEIPLSPCFKKLLVYIYILISLTVYEEIKKRSVSLAQTKKKSNSDFIQKLPLITIDNMRVHAETAVAYGV